MDYSREARLRRKVRAIRAAHAMHAKHPDMARVAGRKGALVQMQIYGGRELWGQQMATRRWSAKKYKLAVIEERADDGAVRPGRARSRSVPICDTDNTPAVIAGILKHTVLTAPRPLRQEQLMQILRWQGFRGSPVGKALAIVAADEDIIVLRRGHIVIYANAAVIS